MSARPGPGGGYHAEWYPYRDQQLRREKLTGSNKLPLRGALQSFRRALPEEPIGIVWVFLSEEGHSGVSSAQTR